MKTALKTTFTRFTLLTTAFFVALIASIALAAQPWTPPNSAPPNDNVPAPINVGPTAQTKTGELTIDNDFTVDGDALVTGGLSVKSLVVDAGLSSLYLSDTNAIDTRIRSNGDDFVIHQGDIVADTWTEKLRISASNGKEWARFSDQVRANEYCDKTGTNCMTAPPVCNGAGQALQFDGTAWNCATAGGSFGTYQTRKVNKVYTAQTDGFLRISSCYDNQDGNADGPVPLELRVGDTNRLVTTNNIHQYPNLDEMVTVAASMEIVPIQAGKKWYARVNPLDLNKCPFNSGSVRWMPIN